MLQMSGVNSQITNYFKYTKEHLKPWYLGAFTPDTTNINERLPTCHKFVLNIIFLLQLVWSKMWMLQSRHLMNNMLQRPPGEHDEHRLRGKAVGEPDEGLPGRVVGPLGVLHDDQAGDRACGQGRRAPSRSRAVARLVGQGRPSSPRRRLAVPRLARARVAAVSAARARRASPPAAHADAPHRQGSRDRLAGVR